MPQARSEPEKTNGAPLPPVEDPRDAETPLCSRVNVADPETGQLKRTWHFTGLPARRLKDAEITQALESGGSLRGANIAGYNASNHLAPDVVIRSDLAGARMEKANFQGCKFGDANLDRAAAAFANFAGASFDGTSAVEAGFIGAKFQGARIRGSDFSSSSLQAADGSGLSVTDSQFNEARCGGADFSGARFEKAELREASLARCQASNAEFAECDMRGTRSYGAKFLPGQQPSISDSMTNGRTAGELAGEKFPTEPRAVPTVDPGAAR